MYSSIFEIYINKIKNEKRYREFLPISREFGALPYAINTLTKKQVVVWCSNDYLGMSQHNLIINSANKAIISYGLGSGGTRNIAGNNSEIVKLEKELAILHNKESALVFTSGYIANETTLASLANIIPNLIFISDEANHASIISGVRNSKAPKFIYHHTNVTHLEKILKEIELDKPKIIVFESVYSMDGLFSPIEEICYLASKYNALTFLDEVHGVGVYGDTGAGVAEYFKCMNRVDIVQGTLSKAYGVIGGYIASTKQLVDSIRLTAPGFIFTTSLPPLIAASARASIQHLRNSTFEREKYKLVVKKVKRSLEQADIDYFKNNSHIIPIVIGDPVEVKKISSRLLNEFNIYIQYVNFPTVPRGKEMLRITPNISHNDQMIQNLSSSLSKVLHNKT